MGGIALKGATVTVLLLLLLLLLLFFAVADRLVALPIRRRVCLQVPGSGRGFSTDAYASIGNGNNGSSPV